MKLIFGLFTTATMLFSNSCSSQPEKKLNDSIAGIWKGTSLCQVKNSPCHDETVVYYITQSATANVYTLKANKIVNGVEEEMGNLDFVYDTFRQTLTCNMKDRQQREAVWTFAIKDKHISGTLIIGGSTLQRISGQRQKNNFCLFIYYTAYH
jgi:hypothetical protein